MPTWIGPLIDLINRLLKLFDKPPTQVIEDKKAESFKTQEQIKAGGRPIWP